jgi:hypothetical protein
MTSTTGEELAERLRARCCPHGEALAAAAELSAELARAEPEGKPDVADAGAMTWRIPGPGGHVRHLVALATIDRLLAELPDPDRPALEREQLRRLWLHGFFLRCSDEVLDA